MAWLTGLVEFEGDATTVLLGVAYAATATTFVTLFSTTGEEIGWHGYMLTRVIEAEVPDELLARPEDHRTQR